MGKLKKLYEHILLQISDSTVPFEMFCALLKRLGFDERIKGDHHIFAKNGVDEIINIQPRKGKAKPYQVKQVREIILKYRIRFGENDG